MASTTFSGPLCLVSPEGFQNSLTTKVIGVGGITDNSATTVGTFTVPNVNASCAGLLIVRTGITTSSHKYDSTRVAMYGFTITRVQGANAVATLSTVFGAAIATSSGGQTTTTALTFASVSGAVGATNTFDLQATNDLSAGTSSETEVTVIWHNALDPGITLESAGTITGS